MPAVRQSAANPYVQGVWVDLDGNPDGLVAAASIGDAVHLNHVFHDGNALLGVVATVREPDGAGDRVLERAITSPTDRHHAHTER